MRKTHVIAEMAWGHDGKIEQAIELLRTAKESGADSFSIHITDVPNYMVKYYGNGEGKVSAGREDVEVYKYLEEINISNEDWVKFNKVAKEINMPLCVMPNDINSLEFSEKSLKPDYYVVSPACFAEQDMLEAIAKTGKKTIFRIGGAFLAEIENAVSTFRKNGNHNIVLLHGFQNYPTKLEETDLSFLPSLKSMFNVEVGLADHLDGGDEFAKILPILSLPYGATFIEKHITLDRSAKSEDFESALDGEGFREMVNLIRLAETSIGTPYFKELSDATLRYRQVVRKRLVANCDIKAGDRVTDKMVIAKRCDIGITPDKRNLVVGRKVKSDMSFDEAFTMEKLD